VKRVVRAEPNILSWIWIRLPSTSPSKFGGCESIITEEAVLYQNRLQDNNCCISSALFLGFPPTGTSRSTNTSALSSRTAPHGLLIKLFATKNKLQRKSRSAPPVQNEWMNNWVNGWMPESLRKCIDQCLWLSCQHSEGRQDTNHNSHKNWLKVASFNQSHHNSKLFLSCRLPSFKTCPSRYDSLPNSSHSLFSFFSKFPEMSYLSRQDIYRYVITQSDFQRCQPILIFLCIMRWHKRRYNPLTFKEWKKIISHCDLIN
jgi:hypothetical protein